MSSSGHRHLFVCGLHRSGTSLITRSLAEHPEVSGFRDTGVIEDEGQFLQTVMPLEIKYGGVGRFGFDPRAHLTENSPLNTAENSRKLLAEWNCHWDATKPVRIEKTPSNLLRMRLLNELARPAQFIIVTRHPVAASLAALKWTHGNVFSLLSHWVHCYRLARSDAGMLRHVVWTSYEAFMADPEGERNRLLAFAGLTPWPGPLPTVRDENQKYFSRWRDMFFGDGDRAIAQASPEHYRDPFKRLKERIVRERGERSLPPYRRAANLRNFYDALDAADYLETAVQEFGYSFCDLQKAPAPEPSLRAERVQPAETNS